MKKFRIIWTEPPRTKYFIGYGIGGTIFLEDSTNAIKYATQDQANLGYNQIKDIMIKNEKKPKDQVEAYLAIEVLGDKQNTNKTNDAYDKAMGVI